MGDEGDCDVGEAVDGREGKPRVIPVREGHEGLGEGEQDVRGFGGQGVEGRKGTSFTHTHVSHTHIIMSSTQMRSYPTYGVRRGEGC